MKSIETVYAGVRFRSRLEARWAVFFDALCIRWEYEPEGFELQDGTRYLPDFYLTRERMFLEIKPTAELAEIARPKTDAFARELETTNKSECINHFEMSKCVCRSFLVVVGHPCREQQITKCVACRRLIWWNHYIGGKPLSDSSNSWSLVGCVWCDILDRQTEDGPGYWWHKGWWASDTIDLTWTFDCARAETRSRFHRFWTPGEAR